MIKDGAVYVECPICENDPEYVETCTRCGGTGYVKLVDATTATEERVILPEPTGAELCILPILRGEKTEYDAKLRWDGGPYGNRCTITLGVRDTQEEAQNIIDLFKNSLGSKGGV